MSECLGVKMMTQAGPFDPYPGERHHSGFHCPGCSHGGDRLTSVEREAVDRFCKRIETSWYGFDREDGLLVKRVLNRLAPHP